MEIKDILLLFGGALLGYLVQLGGDRWRNISDDYEIWTAVESIQIETGDDLISKEAEYAWMGHAPEHPHMTDLYFWSVGKKDITSSQFDAERSLTLSLGAPIVGEIKGGKFVNLDESIVVVDPEGSVTIAPSIIRRRMAGHYRFITDGQLKFSVSNPIANLARVRQLDRERTNTTRALLSEFPLFTILTGALMIVIPPFVLIVLKAVMGTVLPEILQAELPYELSVFMVGGLLLIIISALTMAFAQRAPRRVSRALRILRRSLGEKDALTSTR